MDALKYTVTYLLAAMYLFSLQLGGYWLLAMPVVSFLLIPLLDEILPKDSHDTARSPFLYDLLVRAYLPAQLLAIGATLYALPGLSLLEAALAAFALGILCGAGGINVAHELMHRTGKGDKALAEVLMLSVSYPWFCVEHVLGHHRWVATPNDPATARLGEPLYAFLPRSIAGGLLSFLRIERDYAARRSIRWYSLRDRRTRYALELTLLYAALWGLGGWLHVAFFSAMSAVAVLLLEIINYVEHYGLERRQTAPSVYERVAPEHSWNSRHAVTGAFLFNLPRHSDHHAFASRPYHALRPWPGAPALPLGYAAMVLVALLPPLWFRVMDPRVSAAREVRL